MGGIAATYRTLKPLRHFRHRSSVQKQRSRVPSIVEEATVSDAAADISETNTIDDTTFFPNLAGLFAHAAQSLRKLV